MPSNKILNFFLRYLMFDAEYRSQEPAHLAGYADGCRRFVRFAAGSAFTDALISSAAEHQGSKQ